MVPHPQEQFSVPEAFHTSELSSGLDREQLAGLASHFKDASFEEDELIPMEGDMR
jgi:hypothetical protein